ncbi:hypothetical protein BC629DRAFT_1151614 [Irpex lacteus]|nr:hypothetical protein BC629DRAFT_1151614 [Irpex lacteus]
MSIIKNQWQLRPTSSALSTKYWRSSSVVASARTITPGLFSSIALPNPTYLPESWSAHVHPEGNRYFVRDTCPKIVTEANIYDAETFQQVAEVSDVAVAKLAETQPVISEAIELFLELEDDFCCSYYLIDHSLRAQFWLEEVSSDELGARNCASDDHLRAELERFYWIHVEYFCAHDSIGLELAVNNLVDIMTQGRADQLTSTTSTFPYSAEECGQFIQCLQIVKSSGDSPSALSKWTVARMWQNIADVRFLTHYGQEYARVASNVSILDIDVPEETWLFKCCDILGFKTPQLYLQQLNLQWMDEVAHALRWKTFITACHDEWKMSLLLSFAMLICNLLLVSSPIASSVPVAIAAILLCNASVVVAVTLLLQHGPMGGKQLAEDLSSARIYSLGSYRLVDANRGGNPRSSTCWHLHRDGGWHHSSDRYILQACSHGFCHVQIESFVLPLALRSWTFGRINSIARLHFGGS